MYIIVSSKSKTRVCFAGEVQLQDTLIFTKTLADHKNSVWRRAISSESVWGVRRHNYCEIFFLRLRPIARPILLKLWRRRAILAKRRSRHLEHGTRCPRNRDMNADFAAVCTDGRARFNCSIPGAGLRMEV